LAHQLGTFDPRIGAAVCTIIKENPNVLMSPLPRQFQKLILEPMSQLRPLSQRLSLS
jgi:hypothetical protein